MLKAEQISRAKRTTESQKWHSKEVNNCRGNVAKHAQIYKDRLRVLLIRRNICALIKEVNQQKDMVLISVETCLLCRVEFVAWVFCIYYACQSDAQPDTRELLFCHREPNTHTHTRICAPIMQIFESDKWTENQLQICISVNCGTISAPHALQILKKETQKHYALSQWNLEILFLLRLFRK